MYSSNVRCLLLFICCVLFVSSAHASELSVNGFANVGLTYADDERYRFRTSLLNEGREGLSFKPDTQVGLQLNAQINTTFDAVGQVILQDRDDDHITNYIELAFLRAQINRNWTLRVGRFSTNSYLLTDSRYVGYSYNWLRPPVELYSPVGSLGNMDGIGVNRVTDVDFGVVKISANFGKAKLHNDGTNDDFRVSYKNLTSFNIELQANQWRAQAAYFTATLDDMTFRDIDTLKQLVQVVPAIFKPYAQQLTDSLLAEGTHLHYFSLGGAYYFDNLEITAELANYSSKWDFAIGSTSGYISLAYALDNITPYVILSATKRSREPDVIDFEAAQDALPPVFFEQLVQIIEPSIVPIGNASIDQNTISAGVRWDFASNWAVKFQFDHFRPNERGSGLFTTKNGLQASLKRETFNVVGVSLTTTF